MTTHLNPTVVVEASGLLRVCAWCVPAVRLAELHAQYRCTDGLCTACGARMARESGPVPVVRVPVSDVERLIEETQRVGR